jgi:peptidoglycan/xylan/chitin deacetylase (PgdA/CDA1 family)
MERREAIKTMAIAGAATLFAGTAFASVTTKKHFVTLSFDDGFKKSSIETAKIFEKHGFRACINVVAARTGAKDFLPPDEWHKHPVGAWNLWNELQKRGHEIMPHGLVHADLSAVPFRAAQNMILASLNIFTEKLKGFDTQKAVFNFPYNRSTPELEEWLRGKVIAIRTAGQAINPVPHKGQFRLTCTTGGEWNIDNHLNEEVDKLLNQPEGWLIYNTHGLDEEGWGPVSAKALDALLVRLKDINSVAVVNPGEILKSIN